jgi:hypothetical protein
MIGKRNAQKCLLEKHQGQIPLERWGCRWESNSKMSVKEIGWEGVDWIQRTVVELDSLAC